MTTKQKLTERRKKTPIVKGYLTENPSSRKGWRLFRFFCPFCRTIHQHGFPSAEEYNRREIYGHHRVAHCYVDTSPFRKTGYYLQPFTAKELQEMSHSPAEVENRKVAVTL